MPSGRLWRSGARQATSRPGTRSATARSSRASAPQPITRARVWRASGGATSGRGTALVDQASGRLGGDPGVPAIGVRPDGHAEFLVERRATDENDVVVAHPAVLEGLDDDLHVR